MPLLVAADQEDRCTSARHYIKRLFVGDEARPNQRFVPVDRLRSFLTRDKVIWLLECRCSTCKRDHAAFKRDKTPTEFINRIAGPGRDTSTRWDPAKTALTLFGLLIFIEHPLLIIGFVMRMCSDLTLETRIPGQFSVDYLRGAYCKEFAARVGDDNFKVFAHEFIQYLPQFAIPRMDSGEYSVYGSDTILPFINERKIGVREPDGTIRQEGSNGRVFAFEIYEEYRQFPHAKEHKHFARKEIESTSELAFHLENKNLEQATTLQDPHIVKMIKAYRHGDSFNLIFPLAKTNLDHLLRDEALDTSNGIHGPVESRPAWNELLGIATALGKIGGPNATDSILRQSVKQQFQGVHFDLKPANILVDNHGTWLISDFGQSTFRETSQSSSRVVNQGGTDAYAPPEIDNLDAQFSRRYDIWSLGCIMLEVTAFIVLGYDGLRGNAKIKLRGLDQVRCTRSPWSSREDHRFFCQESQGQGRYIVKKEITDFMKALATSQSLRSQQKSRVFVESVLELITKMLEPEAECRIEIEAVIRRLRSAIDKARGGPQHMGQMAAVEGERSIGEPDLSTISLYHWRANDWHEASLHVFEDGSKNLRTCTALKNNTAPSEAYVVRATTVLIPRYAFNSKSMSEAAIYFSHTNLEGSLNYPGLIFSFVNPKDAWLVQTTLTGHKVEASFPVDGIKYQKYTSLGGRLSHFLLRKEEKEADFTDLGSGTVQLWSEVVDEVGNEDTTRKSSTVSSQEDSLRPVRRQPHQQPGYREIPLRRMVIFIHDLRKIIIVAMDKNWHENKQPADESTFLEFKPRNAARDPSFVATTLQTLQPNNSNSFPGIPLSLKVLRSMEYKNQFECNAIGLTFPDSKSRKTFSGTFEDMRKEWQSQIKEAERQPGYTPIPPQQRRELLPTLFEPESASRPSSWKNPLRSQSTGVGNSVYSGASKAEEALVKHVPHRGGGRGGSRTPLKKAKTTLLEPPTNLRYG